MREERRELIENVLRACNRSDGEAVLDHLHEDVEWIWPAGMAEAEAFRGHEALDARVAWLWTFRGSKVACLRLFGNADKAYDRWIADSS